MISYGTYKLLHLFFILTLFSTLGFAASSSPVVSKKFAKIALGLVSFLLFVAGMGLIARLGFKHGEGFPLWIYLKMGLWIFLNFFLVMIFKLKNLKHKAFMALFILLTGWGAVWVVLNKPI